MESCISDAQIWKIRCRAFILSKIALSQWYDGTVKMTVEPTMHRRVVGSPAQGIAGLKYLLGQAVSGWLYLLLSLLL